MSLPATVGTYELRLFANGNTLLATSNPFTVSQAVSVSGTVTSGGSPLASVAFAAPSGVSCTNSNASGQYQCTGPLGWSGSVTPSLSGYTFTPAARSYNALQASQTGQDFVGALASPSAIYYIVPDQLNTPRLIADQAGNTVWRWDQGEPFGNDVPNNNPSGAGAFEFNLRLPGQYFDRETNLAYNFFRDYDPGLGRYVQSDMVGLKGGTNTYSYALQNPIRYIDILGLDVNFCYYPDFPTHIGFGIVGEDAKTQGFYPKRHRSPVGPGIVKPDPNPGDEPRECKTVVATPKQDKCMLACRERRKNNPGTYNGATRQCTDFVRDCALECNVPVGDHGGPFPKWFYDGIKASEFPE